jgi:hypothetical protein
MSERTLARRFEAEVGMSVRSWRRRLRLFEAIELLGGGLVLELWSEISASLQASTTPLPCAICTPICRSVATTCSALQFLQLVHPVISGSFGSGQLS